MPEGARTVREHLQALTEHQLDQALSYLSPELQVELPSLFGHPSDCRRFAALLRAALRAFPDLRVHLVDLEERRGQVLARWVVTGTFKAPFLDREPTGQRIVVRGLSLDTVRQGRIRRRKILLDTGQLLSQLRVMPATA